MAIININRENCLTSHWSGGTTTELYIYPPESSYIRRDFDLRISTALVEAPESTFTKLPGIRRHLIILDGEIRLYPDNQEQRRLGKGDKIFFPGDWDMRSEGTCEDFNVMTSKKIDTAVDTLSIQQETCQEVILASSWQSVFLYCVSGKASLHLAEDILPFNNGTLLLITGKEMETCTICAETNTEIISVFTNNKF